METLSGQIYVKGRTCGNYSEINPSEGTRAFIYNILCVFPLFIFSHCLTLTCLISNYLRTYYYAERLHSNSVLTNLKGISLICQGMMSLVALTLSTPMSDFCRMKTKSSPILQRLRASDKQCKQALSALIDGWSNQLQLDSLSARSFPSNVRKLKGVNLYAVVYFVPELLTSTQSMSPPTS